MYLKRKHTLVPVQPIFLGCKLLLFLTFMLPVILLTACEGRGGTDSAESIKPIQVNAPVLPQTTISIDPLLPPGSEVRPLLPGETGSQRTADGLPILDSKGPILRQLFKQEIKDPSVRMNRIENAVVEMREDLDSMVPAIKRLLLIEGDIQALTTQLKTLLADDNPSLKNDLGQESIPPMSDNVAMDENALSPSSLHPPPPPHMSTNSDVVVSSADSKESGPVLSSSDTPDVSEAIQKKNNNIDDVVSASIAGGHNHPKVVAKQGDGIHLDSIRFGNHPDKTRIVIDSSKEIKFTTDLDNQEHILIVDLPDVVVHTETKSVAGNPFIKSVSLNAAKDQNSSGQVVFELNKKAQIKLQTIMPPNKDQPNFRVVIDLVE